MDRPTGWAMGRCSRCGGSGRETRWLGFAYTSHCPLCVGSGRRPVEIFEVLKAPTVRGIGSGTSEGTTVWEDDSRG